ncbi:ty3-gypsy retrotransposon protein [Tanacetum coccineum]
MDTVYKLNGMPESIVSDRDKIFISAFWKELFKTLKVKLYMLTAYHPQTDGHTEVVNRCLEGYLRCMTGEQPKKWFEWLPLAKIWYNTNYHTSIDTTPFEVVYGHTSPIHVPYLGGLSKINAVDRRKLARKEAIQMIKFHLLRSQNKMKQQADKSRPEREFVTGDMVFLKLQPHRQQKMVKKNNKVVVYGLVQWANGTTDDASWEDLRKLVDKFPEFDLSS